MMIAQDVAGQFSIIDLVTRAIDFGLTGLVLVGIYLLVRRFMGKLIDALNKHNQIAALQTAAIEQSCDRACVEHKALLDASGCQTNMIRDLTETVRMLNVEIRVRNGIRPPPIVAPTGKPA